MFLMLKIVSNSSMYSSCFMAVQQLLKNSEKSCKPLGSSDFIAGHERSFLCRHMRFYMHCRNVHSTIALPFDSLYRHPCVGSFWPAAELVPLCTGWGTAALCPGYVCSTFNHVLEWMDKRLILQNVSIKHCKISFGQSIQHVLFY